MPSFSFPFRRARPVVLGLLAALSPLAAAEPVALREMSTDRPDSTESPFTVNPGRVQLEMDFANYTRDRADGTRTVEWEVAPFNLRFGITRHFEAGIFLLPFRREIVTPPGGPREIRSGTGDAVLRAKWNFQGNDDDKLGLGLIADLKVPTGARALSNRQFEGALTFPVAFDLGGGWGGGAMTTLEIVYADTDRHRAVWSNTCTVGRALTERTAGFIELTSSAGDGAHVATFNCGLTHRLNPDLQFDAGVNVGLSRSAPDLLFFAGVSRRF